jgi:hypothetical protein
MFAADRPTRHHGGDHDRPVIARMIEPVIEPVIETADDPTEEGR